MPHFGARVMQALRYILRRKLVILGGALYVTAFLSLLGLLSVAQLSAAVPSTALSFVVDTLGARFILHEHVPWKRWAGVLCVTAGVILAVKSGVPQSPNSVLPTRQNSPAGLQGSARPRPEPSRGL
jgi:drug/metabolite transporter (DMT)-like permease